MEENVWITKEAMEHKKKWKIVKSILKLNFKKMLKLTLKQNLNNYNYIYEKPTQRKSRKNKLNKKEKNPPKRKVVRNEKP